MWKTKSNKCSLFSTIGNFLNEYKRLASLMGPTRENLYKPRQPTIHDLILDKSDIQIATVFFYFVPATYETLYMPVVSWLSPLLANRATSKSLKQRVTILSYNDDDDPSMTSHDDESSQPAPKRRSLPTTFPRQNRSGIFQVMNDRRRSTTVIIWKTRLNNRWLPVIHLVVIYC